MKLLLCTAEERLSTSRAFPTSTNANEHILLALGSDRKGRDNVKISRGRGQSACSRRFIRVKPRETNIQRML